MNAPRLFATEAELPPDTRIIDALPQARAELFFVENPTLRKESPEGQAALEAYLREDEGSFVFAYYPWLSAAVRIPDEATYFKLRTARNRDLITQEEQQAYRNASVGIAGLSVGSAALGAIVATGGPRTIKIADPDTIDVTNLNRIQAILIDVGRNKTEVAAERNWELDPFLSLECFPEGITKENFDRFLSKPRLDVFIDEMDAIALKIEARERCRALGIPVVMATDNGDGTLLDIERFDLEPNRPIFHGNIEIAPQELSNLTRDQFVRLANRIIGASNFSIRQQNSLMQIGSKISGVPQLFTAAMLSGAAVALAVRRITTGQDMPSGRYTLSLESVLEPDYSAAPQVQARQENTERFNAHFG